MQWDGLDKPSVDIAFSLCCRGFLTATPAFIFHHFHPGGLMMSAETEHLVHLQSLGYLVGYEQHGDFALEFVDGAGEVLGGLLVEVGNRFVEDQDFGPLE